MHLEDRKTEKLFSKPSLNIEDGNCENVHNVSSIEEENQRELQWSKEAKSKLTNNSAELPSPYSIDSETLFRIVRNVLKKKRGIS